MTKNTILVFKALFWIYALTIIFISISPSAGIQEIKLFEKEWRIDYVLHTLAFFVLPVFGFVASQNGSWKKRWFQFLLFSLVLVFGTELAQLFVSGRTFNPFDIVSNLTGFLLGFTAVVLLIRYRKNRTK